MWQAYWKLRRENNKNNLSGWKPQALQIVCFFAWRRSTGKIRKASLVWKSQGKRIMADWSTRTSSQHMMRQTRPIIPASFLHHFCAHCIYIIHILDLDRFGLQTEASNLRPSVPWSWENTDEELRRWKRRQDSRHPDISYNLKTHRTHMVLIWYSYPPSTGKYWDVPSGPRWEVAVYGLI